MLSPSLGFVVKVKTIYSKKLKWEAMMHNSSLTLIDWPIYRPVGLKIEIHEIHEIHQNFTKSSVYIAIQIIT